MIFTFAFIYRLALTLSNTFPPGADIGLHNSVIHTITGAGNVDLFYNPYHMGGGLSLTFPGYHLFTTNIILMTGLPEYVAQAAVVSLFSALIVLAAFLITRVVWSEPAAYIVSFLVAISRFDIEMLLWAGYPNVITLLLIPVVLYMHLQRKRFSSVPFFVSTSILVGSIFLTHSLSAALYVGITVIMVLFVLFKPKLFATTRKDSLYWLFPIFFGALLFAPFLIQAVPAYLQNSSSLADSDSSTSIKLATIATQRLPLDLVLPLFGILPGLLLFSKKCLGRFFALPAFLLMLWLCVPLILSQSYLVGFAIDYNRFLYFLLLPMIIFIGILIEHGSSFFAQKLGTRNGVASQRPTVTNVKLVRFLTAPKHKTVYRAFILFFLMFSFLLLPIFMGPVYAGGKTIQQFYQTMDSQLMEPIQWAKTNTSPDSVFVADALYGWWFSGFAQRKTYSAVDPQYLSINEEFNKTLFARSLLDTDYLIDNGYFQVREDGGFTSRHNPSFLAHIRNEYFPYAFFNFENNYTVINVGIGEDKTETINLSSLPIVDMHRESTENSESIIVNHGSDLFNFTQTVTIYTAANSSLITTHMAQYFAKVTEKIQTDNPNVTFNSATFGLATKGTENPIISPDYTHVGLIDAGMKTIGHLVFSEPQSRPQEITLPQDKEYSPIGLTYDLDAKTNVEFSFAMGVYQYSDAQQDSINAGTYTFKKLMQDNTEIYLSENSNVPPPRTEATTQPLYVFDYRDEVRTWNVSYVAVRGLPTEEEKRQIALSPHLSRFVDDPLFSLVFINEEVAIFKVHGNLK
jgi:hypothetical protein